jgi:hypothetical protein
MESEAFHRVWNDVVSIVESFTGKGSLEPIFRRLSLLSNQVSKDQWASVYFRDVRNYVTDMLKHPGKPYLV